MNDLIIETMWNLHFYLANFRPLFHIGGVILTIIILALLLLEEINNDKKK